MRYPVFIIGLLFSCSLHAQNVLEILDSLGRSILDNSHTYGAYLSIQKKDSLLYSKAFGYKDKATRGAFDRETVFPISSNTKAFNAMMLLQLDEAGRMDLAKPIIQYLPEIEFSDSYLTNNATTIDLLTHRCGLPRYDFAFMEIQPQQTINANEIVFDRLKHMKLSSDFRASFAYGNIQYIIAAQVYERMTGEKWEDGLSKNILEPLSMSNTHCDYKRYVQTENKSKGYKDGEEIAISYDVGLYSVSGMGNMFSTVKDLEQWAAFLINGNDSIISPMYRDFALSTQFSTGYEEAFDGFSSIAYGLGWYIFDYWGHKVVLHHGDNSGHQSIIVLLPDDDISWVIIANEAPQRAGFPFRMTFSLLDIFTGNTLNNWSELLQNSTYDNIRYPDSLADKTLKPTAGLKEYYGQYENEHFGRIDIVERAGRMYAELGLFSEELEHWKGDSFRIHLKDYDEDYIFHFELDEENKVRSLRTDLVEPSVDMEQFEKQ